MSKRLLLIFGLVLLVILHGLHFADVLGGTAGGWWGAVTLIVRANMTPLAWCAYLVMLLGLLTLVDGVSWLRRFRNRFLICWLWSVPAWCYFDWMNFYFMRDPKSGLRAWEYVNLPVEFSDRLVGYLLAFGAIAPGMFLTAEVLQRAGLFRVERAVEAGWKRVQDRIAVGVFVLGLVLTPVPFWYGTAASNLAVWVGTWALLDPINRWFGRPSILEDWFRGRFGRTLALGAGGLLCGFLWEFWNFWAITKWQYHLPFLGSWEEIRYFEMPALGLVGFIAFALETWAMWQTALLVLSPFCEAEGRVLEGDRVHREYACL